MSIANRGAESVEPFRAALVGHICVDHNLIDGHAQPRSWGSAVLFARQYLSGLPGVCAQVIAPYGEDFGDYWPEISIVNRPTGERTLVYVNDTVHNVASRRSSHTENTAPVELDATVRQSIASASLVVVAPLLPNFSDEYIARLKQIAMPSARFVLLAQGFLRRVGPGGAIERREFVESRAVLAHFDVVILADDDISDNWYTARAEALRWSREHPNLKVIVTRNARGAVLFEAGIQTAYPTRPLAENRITDAVGAGDTFGAAAALSFARTGIIADAIAAGHAAARDFLVQRG